MLISIVIPLYNKEQSITSTLQTVLKQTFQDFEIIIVDDGSTDHSVEEVNKVVDPRIRLIQQPNAGVSSARNRGIEEAKGEYIAFLDADDEWKPEYLETQYNLTQQYLDCSVFACNYEFRDIQGNVRSTIIRKLPFTREYGVLSNYFEVASCSHPPLWTSAVMVKKDAIQSVGGFPVGIKSGEDLLTWARLACRYIIAFARTSHVIYNLGEGYNKKNLPPRRQDKGDPVGKELVNIYKKYPKTLGLKTYISHWHKMRASVAVRYNERRETIYEVFLSLRYNILNIKVMPFLVLALLPQKMRYMIISHY
ncbi:glycosyltransferase family 2 protein [Phocaeicola sp. HCN-6420]|uniref:glycosyltransferase family 2 protein n=1 Tax=Phocaeicola sp. HCN-6420 TaxID=3134673 RepID=UPI0030C0CE0A